MMNMKTTLFRYGALALGWCLALNLQAQNYGALQHLLQPTPKAESFPQNRFNDHLFFSVGAGMHTLLWERDAQSHPGARFDAYLGKWITPAQGVRIGAGLGFQQVAPFDATLKMGSLQADYLLNISSLASGYDPSRRFEVVGLAGVEVGYSRVNQHAADGTLARHDGLYYGIRGGVQGVFRLTNTLDLYVEPRVGFYTDDVIQVESWRNYRVKGDVLLGLTYEPAAPMGRHLHHDAFETKPFGRHTFLLVAGGAAAPYTRSVRHLKEDLGAVMALGAGKWFSPSSGVRLWGTLGYQGIEQGGRDVRLKAATLRADYLWNVPNTLWGYDADRLFTLTGIVGVNLAATKQLHDPTVWAPGLGVGLQGGFRVNPWLEWFIEPRLNFYTSRYAQGLGNHNQVGEVLVGFNYHHTRTCASNAAGRAAFAQAHPLDHLFLEAGVGGQLFLNRTNLEKGKAWGPQLSLALGKWFSPYSGLRVVGAAGFWRNYAVPGSFWRQLAAQYYSQHPSKPGVPRPEFRHSDHLRHVSASLGVDYLWNITASLAGYRPDRVFELITSLGAHLAYTSQAYALHHGWQPGLNAGLQTRWNVNDRLGLYVEPQVRLYKDSFTEGNLGMAGADAMLAVMAGFHYRFVPYSQQANRSAFQQADTKRRFVSLSVGTSGPLTSNRNILQQAGYQLTASYGEWFSPLSLWRAHLDFTDRRDIGRSHLRYWGVGADYLLSLGTLATGYDPDRRFDFLPFVGATFGFSHVRGANHGVPGVDFGAQLKVKLHPAFDLYVEPRFGFRADPYDGYKQHQADRLASFQAGVSYNF